MAILNLLAHTIKPTYDVVRGGLNALKKQTNTTVTPPALPQSTASPTLPSLSSGSFLGSTPLPSQVKTSTPSIAFPKTQATPQTAQSALPVTTSPTTQKTQPTPTAQGPQPSYSVTQPSIPSVPSPTQNVPRETFDDTRARLEEEFNARIAAAKQEKTSSSPAIPQIPGVSDELKNAISAAEKAYIQSLQISPEELSTQEELDRLAESTRAGYEQARNQTIPLGFITGQLAAIERRALALQEPLEKKMARLQAARLASSEASKFALNRLEQKAEEETQKAEQAQQLAREEQRAAQGDIREFGGQLVRVTPDGQVEVLANAPQAPVGQDSFTLSPGEVRYDAQGNVIARGGEKIESVPSSIQEYIFARGQGFTGSFNEYQNQKTNQNLTVEQAKAQQFATAASNADQILGDLNYDPGFIESSLVPNAFKSAARQQFEQAARAFVNATLRRESGATITDDEFTNKYRELIPIAGDSQAVKQQKMLARQSAVQSIAAAGGSNFQLGNNQNAQQFSPEELEYIRSNGIDPNQLGFKQVGSDTNQADKIAAAIKQVESGGNYNARGASGEGGAYQFMPSTWKDWATQYLGDSNAPQTPQNQDYVAKAKIQDLLNKGYNAQQIALIWNGGQPIVKKGVNRFGVAYDSGAYANKVLSALNSIG